MKFYMTKRINVWGPRIELLEVERATEQSVWINGRRHARQSEWDNFFPTWTEAHEFLLKAAERKLLAARRELENAQGLYGNVKGMKEPQ